MYVCVALIYTASVNPPVERQILKFLLPFTTLHAADYNFMTNQT